MDKNDPKYQSAIDRVRREKAFYLNAISFIPIIAVLAGINYWLDRFENPWVLWVAGFWALGLVLRGFKLFGAARLFGRDWEERKIKEYMDKDRDGFR